VCSTSDRLYTRLRSASVRLAAEFADVHVLRPVGARSYRRFILPVSGCWTRCTKRNRRFSAVLVVPIPQRPKVGAVTGF
jgi:hypothetical protein